MSLLDELEPVLTDLSSEFPVVVDSAAQGSAIFHIHLHRSTYTER
jgi:hypothetical protein